MTIHKVLKYLALVIGVIGLILLGRVLVTGDDAITNSGSVQSSILDPMLILTYIVFGIVVLLVLFYVIVGLFKGNIKNTLLSIGVFAAIVVVSYLVAGGGSMYDRNGVELISDSGSKWVDTGLYVFYILGAVAILSMLLSGARKLFSK